MDMLNLWRKRSCKIWFVGLDRKIGRITTFHVKGIKELEKKGIQGKIITTDYQLFTEPKALDKLAALKNISLKIYCIS